jgi:outer membrane protein OmpA-like peptidoglycan-associated protein
MDSISRQKLANAKISLFDDKLTIIDSLKSDQNGYYQFKVECGKTYRIRAEKQDYTTKEQAITISDKDGKTTLDITLEKAFCKVVVGDDLGKCFGIKWIYFDFDKSNIRPEAALDLAKILDVLEEYPNMKIDIRSYTDSRGSSKYNEALSERRAKSTQNWLIKNGVSPDRLTSKGYGESKLVNKCSDGVICTDEEHLQNRRSEFIITAL